VYKKSV